MLLVIIQQAFSHILELPISVQIKTEIYCSYYVSLIQTTTTLSKLISLSCFKQFLVLRPSPFTSSFSYSKDPPISTRNCYQEGMTNTTLFLCTHTYIHIHTSSGIKRLGSTKQYGELVTLRKLGLFREVLFSNQMFCGFTWTHFFRFQAMKSQHLLYPKTPPLLLHNFSAILIGVEWMKQRYYMQLPLCCCLFKLYPSCLYSLALKWQNLECLNINAMYNNCAHISKRHLMW